MSDRIIPTEGMGGMGRIAPGTVLTVREATPDEVAYEEQRIRSLDPDRESEWLGHRWFVVLNGDPEKVLKDWWTPVGGATREEALREAEKYARARGAVVDASTPTHGKQD